MYLMISLELWWVWVVFKPSQTSKSFERTASILTWLVSIVLSIPFFADAKEEGCWKFEFIILFNSSSCCEIRPGRQDRKLDRISNILPSFWNAPIAVPRNWAATKLIIWRWRTIQRKTLFSVNHLTTLRNIMHNFLIQIFSGWKKGSGDGELFLLLSNLQQSLNAQWCR